LVLISIITIPEIMKYESNKYKSLESVEYLKKNTKYTQNFIWK